MKHSAILVAVTVAVVVYATLNYYCIKRSAQASVGLGVYTTAVIGALIVLACALPLGRIAEIYFRNAVTHFLVNAGSLYLGAMFYMVIIAVLADCVRLADRFFHFFPSSLYAQPFPALRTAWLALACLLILTIAIGNHLAAHPRLRCIDMSVAKKSSPLTGLTIAVVSDIHFGTVLGERHMKRIVRLVKQAGPDLVLLAGDVFDEDVDDRQRHAIVGLLKELSCPMGVYAVTGNHDYYSGLEKAVSVLGEGGVIVLQDTAVTINRAFNLVGRKDLTALRMGGVRKKLEEVLTTADRGLPCILMDHQPFHLEEAEKNNIDVQFSGHTHHGQLFPLNLLYRWIYETSWGHIYKGKTQIVVSCGAGAWGPPVRTNSFSEVLKIRMRFADLTSSIGSPH